MSWDAMILRLTGDGSEEDVTAQPMGSAAEVRARLSEALPALTWDGLHGRLDEVELELATVADRPDDTVEVVHVRARGDNDPVPALCGLARACQAELFDCQSGALIDLDDPSSATWNDFIGYR